jgi:putative methyltransferase (TIGR04325 family)
MFKGIRFVGEYNSFEEAAADGFVTTYEDPAVIASRLYKARRYYAEKVPHKLLAASGESHDMFTTIAREGLPKQIRVLDFGGGLGPGYAVASRSELAQAEIFWAAVDLPACVASAKEFETSHLKFFDSIVAARAWLGGVDIVYVNSVLQYLPSPEETLMQLCSLDARWVALLRTVLGPRRCIQIMESPLSWEYVGSLAPGVEDRTMRNICTTLPVRVFQNIMAEAKYARVSSIKTQNGQPFQNEQFLYKKS